MESNFRNSLAPPDPRWKGLGALERPPDVRDYHMEFLPKVMATAPPPSLVTMSPEQWPLVYDQNGYGACVDNSECGTMTAENYTESNKTEIVAFDALEAYFANGGLPDGSNGIPTSLSLERMRNIGALDKKTGRRRKIANYAFAPRQSEAFREAIASALASGSFVVLATLLPARFGRHSTGNMTSGYHQIVIANYDGLRDDDEFNGPNSWGLGFGERGFYGMTWRHVIQQDFQNGYSYAYVLVDAKDYEPPDPPPDPNHYSFLGLVAKVKSGKLLITPDSLPANIKGRRVSGVTIEDDVLSFDGKVKRSDEDIVVLKGEFEASLEMKRVQVQTV